MFLPVAVVAALGLGLAHAAPATQTYPTIDVDLDYTQYEGYKLPSGINQWLGMRYAAAPLGELRFKAPQDPPKSGKTTAHEVRLCASIRRATTNLSQHGALCHFTPSTKLDPTHSEDCLFIDVSAPANNTGPHPVYFFIQGGGLNTLSNSNPDPEKLIQASGGNIVVVSFNYRVGPWGFLASKEVKAGGNLNAGLLDQRMALHWVQKYIHLVRWRIFTPRLN